MTEMTDDQVNRVLAKLVGKDGHFFKPTLVRDDLAEVLAELSDAQWEATLESIRRNTPCFPASLVDPQNPDRHLQGAKWLLTCDPAIIARAVAEVVSK